jgi:hypothetical protein
MSGSNGVCTSNSTNEAECNADSIAYNVTSLWYDDSLCLFMNEDESSCNEVF